MYVACGIDMLAVKLIKQDRHPVGYKRTTYLKTYKNNSFLMSDGDVLTPISASISFKIVCIQHWLGL